MVRRAPPSSLAARVPPWWPARARFLPSTTGPRDGPAPARARLTRLGGLNKFSPSEWSNSNHYHYNSSDQSRHQSERIRGEALRLIADRDRRTVASQRQVDHQLEDRIRNIASWRSELGAELDRNKNETNLMFKTRSERFLINQVSNTVIIKICYN